MTILQIPPEAPAIVHVAAASILYLHIGCGFVAMAAGGVAILARKGQRLHRTAGKVFLVSMLIVAGIGAAVAPFLPQRVATVAGLLTFYLVATGWATLRRQPGQVGRFEVAALVLALATAALGLVVGWQAFNSPGGALNGEPYQAALVLTAFAALGAVGDLRMILRGGVSGPPRIARHIWRMGVPLIIATLSFVAQPAAIPDSIEGSPFLFLPILGVVALTIYWLVRIRIQATRRRPLRAKVVARIVSQAS